MLRKDFLWGGAVTAHQSEGGYTVKPQTLPI